MRIFMTKIVAIFMIGVLFFNISINCFPQVIDPVNQAKADASADMSQRSWFLLGAFLPLSPIIGCLAGSAVNNTSSGSLVIGLPNDTQFGGAITLGLTGCLVLPLSISKMPIRPSPEKLLGKSPEYYSHL